MEKPFELMEELHVVDSKVARELAMAKELEEFVERVMVKDKFHPVLVELGFVVYSKGFCTVFYKHHKHVNDDRRYRLGAVNEPATTWAPHRVRLYGPGNASTTCLTVEELRSFVDTYLWAMEEKSDAD